MPESRTNPRAAEFAALHHQSEPLLLPNVWDRASALLLADAGFRAVATTSLGVAAGAGLADGARMTRDATLRLARTLGGDRGGDGDGDGGGEARRDARFLFSVDAEDGYSDDPDEVAGFVAELARAGAVGVNLEDGSPDGTLTDPASHAAKIAAVKAAVPDMFVNARTDTYWLGVHAAETADRLTAYREAGADGVFVPGLADADVVQRLVAGIGLPLNLLYRPAGPGIAELGRLGVRRVSLGSLLYRVALGAALDAASAVERGLPAGLGAPGYAAIQRLSARDNGEEA
jgi:2-methylisocitrate lyase-like PEP mutase family enzyme